MTDSKNIVQILNERSYFDPTILDLYTSYDLSRTEAITLLKYQPHFADKDVLDIGVGTGRTTVYLAPLARRYESIDFSPAMIEFMNKAMPQISAKIGDMRKLAFDAEEFDFVMGSFNVIDEVIMPERLETLVEVHRVLKPAGVFVFSSHNLSYQFAGGAPRLKFSKNPLMQTRNIVKWLYHSYNHLRVKKFRVFEENYAILNDEGHAYSALHMYIDQNYQRQQLKDKGFVVLDVFDIDANSVSEQGFPKTSPYLMYVAQKS